MTTQQAMELAKEKLGKNITEQEAQDYIGGKTAIPDEALAIVSGGGTCTQVICPNCGSLKHDVAYQQGDAHVTCRECGTLWVDKSYMWK